MPQSRSKEQQNLGNLNKRQSKGKSHNEDEGLIYNRECITVKVKPLLKGRIFIYRQRENVTPGRNGQADIMQWIWTCGMKWLGDGRHEKGNDHWWDDI